MIRVKNCALKFLLAVTYNKLRLSGIVKYCEKDYLAGFNNNEQTIRSFN